MLDYDGGSEPRGQADAVTAAQHEGGSWVSSETNVRAMAPHIVQEVEMFSDVILRRGRECRVVQVKHCWWLFNDGTYILDVYDPDDRRLGSAHYGSDASGLQLLKTRMDAMWTIAKSDD